MLNCFIRGSEGECFTTVDLMEADLLTGRARFIKSGAAPSFETGLAYFVACLPIAIVGLFSAIHQGQTSVASIGLVTKKPDQFGKAMLLPAMVETYAILALLISILAIFNL